MASSPLQSSRRRRRSPEDPGSEVARWVAASVEARPDAARGAFEVADHVVPLIRAAGFVASVDAVLARAGGLAHQHVAADLHVVYAVDHREGLQMLDWDGARAAGLVPDTIAERASTNLVRVIGEGLGARVHPMGVGFVAAGGTFDASVLLLDAYWSEMEGHLPGPLLAAVPSRDTLVFCREVVPEAVAELRRHVEHASAGDHPVSRTILRRSGGRWTPWAAP